MLSSNIHNVSHFQLFGKESAVMAIKHAKFTLFCHDGRGGGKKALLPKTCHTYLTIVKLGTLIPYLKKIQKTYKVCDTLLDFC